MLSGLRKNVCRCDRRQTYGDETYGHQVYLYHDPEKSMLNASLEVEFGEFGVRELAPVPRGDLVDSE